MESTDSAALQKIVMGLVMGQLTIHNVIRRNFENLAKIDVEGAEDQQRAFVETGVAFMELIHGHHSTEEDYWFPTISKKTGVSLNNFVEDHKVFDKIWSEVNEKLAAMKANFEGSDPSLNRAETLVHVKGLFKTMQDGMLPHLQLEENTITADLLAKHFNLQELKEVNHELMAVVKSHMSPVAHGLFFATLTNEERAKMMEEMGGQQQQH